MELLPYLNFIIANAFLIFATLFLFVGFIVGVKLKSIRMKSQRHTNIIFIDTGEIFDHWGWNDVFSLEDADYVVDHHKVKGGSIFFDSRFAESPQFEAYQFDKTGIPPVNFVPDMNRWLYWIDSKMFFRVYENKILEKMMQIQATDLIKTVLVVCCLSLLAGVITIYFVYKTGADIGTISGMMQELYARFKIG